MYTFFLANYLIVIYDSLHASDMCFLLARSSQRSDNRTYSSTSHGQSGGSNRYDNYNQGEGDSSYFRHYWECLCSLNNNLSSQNIILLFIFSICLEDVLDLTTICLRFYEAFFFFQTHKKF